MYKFIIIKGNFLTKKTDLHMQKHESICWINVIKSAHVKYENICQKMSSNLHMQKLLFRMTCVYDDLCLWWLCLWWLVLLQWLVFTMTCVYEDLCSDWDLLRSELRGLSCAADRTGGRVLAGLGERDRRWDLGRTGVSWRPDKTTHFLLLKQNKNNSSSIQIVSLMNLFVNMVKS